jgi:glycerophosphoryl diester phosphodiesterase
MKIIAHRGAPKLAPENTLKSICTANHYAVAAIEIDVRTTKDGRLGLCQDKDLERIAGDRRLVSQLNYDEIKTIRTTSGEPIATVEQAIRAAKHPLIIECKDRDWAKPLADILKKTSYTPYVVYSYNHAELLKFQALRPDIKLGVIELIDPLRALFFAKKHQLHNICLKSWILQPLVYTLARRNDITVFVYSIDYKWIAKLVHKFYPEVIINTNHPEKLTKNY